MSSPDQPIPDIAELVQRPLGDWGVRDSAALDGVFSRLQAAFDHEIAELREKPSDAGAAEAFRVRWLGRKQGILRSVTDTWLKSAPNDLKREVGQRANALREMAERQIEELKLATSDSLNYLQDGKPIVELEAHHAATPQDRLDITLPGKLRQIGVRHPIRKAIDEITDIFRAIGFSVEEGPEIESVYYNFEALNIPEDHPSRDDQDTFYIDANTVLRTHTSPVQIRTMERQKPPLRIIVPGKVYRNETPDASHACMFHQVEGLAVDTNITFADLKGTLDYFMKAYYGSEVRTRFRPSFFPFTEPSAEMDVSCFVCGGTGCRLCKGSGWLEMGGCGMVDPAVFAYARYDASQYSGFAFGFGVERLAMPKYGVNDIQDFFRGDLRFLHQFR